MRLEAVDETAFAHVDNRYYDGIHYDRRYAGYTWDTEFWCSFAESVGRDVLELAAGTGRLSVPMAVRGLDVVALDISPSMLARARAKVTTPQRARFLTGDMRDFDLDRQFDLVLLACSSVCHLLSDDDAKRCFDSVRRHLQAGGTFALDLAAPQRETSTADGSWRPRFRYPDPAGTGEVVVSGRRRYDPTTRLLTDELDYEFVADGRVERATRVSRMYPFEELVSLLERSALHVVESYGGFDRQPLTVASEVQVLICSLTPSGVLDGTESPR
ncbi:class I SAM-dependent methyltransferase [Streptomyces silvisoli]|uniref:Class I SAM-dependent methyltransferase n=1 Tax=Streptomyces silvisoli TaxID=3034235 RepID=A0ABT5ZL46_9ACTN|nr:class I SAM-dependent methyltransferase [Streptomyces silvisoli]MDF3290305.1 class I SAM-dependent methyltransferase [Streptomyces silvisoli]